MADKTRYGRNSDGSVSPCHAKPENVGRYGCHHAEHMELTMKQAQAINEAAARAASMPEDNSLQKSKKADYLKLVNSISEQDGDRIYDRAMDAIEAMESENRFPVQNVDTILPEPVTGDRVEVEESELSSIRSGKLTNLIGRVLIGDEEKAIGNRLIDYSARKINRLSNDGYSYEPTPAEERALATLTSNPRASHDEMMSLAKNKDVMSFGARFIVNSPYVDDDVKKAAYDSSPDNALESQSLSGDLVNNTVKNTWNHRLEEKFMTLHTAFRHPNLDSAVAYNTMNKARHDFDEQKRGDLEWQLSLNPNPQFQEKLAALDAKDNTPANQLQSTRIYMKNHPDFNPDTALTEKK